MHTWIRLFTINNGPQQDTIADRQFIELEVSLKFL